MITCRNTPVNGCYVWSVGCYYLVSFPLIGLYTHQVPRDRIREANLSANMKLISFIHTGQQMAAEHRIEWEICCFERVWTQHEIVYAVAQLGIYAAPFSDCCIVFRLSACRPVQLRANILCKHSLIHTIVGVNRLMYEHGIRDCKCIHICIPT